MGSFGKNLALWVIIGLLLVALFNLFRPSSSTPPTNELAFSQFMAEVEGGRVTDVTIEGNSISGHLANSEQPFSTYAPNDPDLVRTLRDNKVAINAKPVTERSPGFFDILIKKNIC